mgnify:CR=1 FL=1
MAIQRLPIKKKSLRTAAKVSLIYAVFSILWVLFSDQIVLALISDTQLLIQVQMIKGWLFVSVTAVLIYFLLVREIDSKIKSRNDYQTIFNATSDALIVYNRESSQIENLNLAAITLFGYSYHEATQITIQQLAIEETHIPTSDDVSELVVNGNTSYISHTHNKKGEKFWAEVSIHNNVHNQQSTVTIRDISLQKRSHDVLRALAETGPTSSDDVFKMIVQQVAQSLNVRYALIATVNADNKEATTLAMWDTDHHLDNTSYPLSGTPCENVFKRGVCRYPNNVQHRFPKDTMLVDIDAESYIGVPLRASDDTVLGLLAILDDKHMETAIETVELLDSLATRATIELERKIADEKLKLSSRVFDETREGILVTDTNGLIVDVNPTFCLVTEYSREEVIGQTPGLLNSGKQSPKFYVEMWETLEKTGYWQGEVWNRKKNGELYAEQLSISSLTDDTGTVINYVGIFTDITITKEQKQQLELMAHYDVLTKLPNRILFADRFTQAVAHSKRTETLMAVCFLDLDDFKPVNDTYGHLVGDQLLVEVAERIQANIRESDTVSRQGGDEFAFFLVDLESPFDGEVMLERIQHAIAQPYFIDGHRIDISSSMGVTIYPIDDVDLDTLLRHADQAMYQAKLAGKNNYHIFNVEHDKQTIHKHHRLNEISQALANNELCLYYQPKVNMKTGQIFGMEGLLRWNHPEKGMIPPLEFLPVIEGTSFETKLGDWVIEQALQQLDKWNAAGIQLQVSVNISSRHLQSAHFFASLDQALANHPHVNSKDFQLEILESSALGDVNKVKTIIETCRDKLGVCFALDDFGTGYSSLTHLRNLPARTIKIDQSFVRDMLLDPNDFAIIDGVIGLASSFNRKIVAEGVETTEHGLMLLVMGCELAQGYGIARPMPAGEVIEWLATYQPNQQWLQCATRELAHADQKLKLLSLAFENWYEQYQKSLNLAASNDAVAPILEHKKCHCHAWIKREKREATFNATWLEQVDQAHQTLHLVSQDIFNYKKRDTTIPNEQLEKMQTSVAEITSLLDSQQALLPQSIKTVN